MPNYFEIHTTMYKLWPGQAKFITILSLDLQDSLTLTFNLPEQMFLLLKDSTCAKLFSNPYINVQVMA